MLVMLVSAARQKLTVAWSRAKCVCSVRISPVYERKIKVVGKNSWLSRDLTLRPRAVSHRRKCRKFRKEHLTLKEISSNTMTAPQRTPISLLQDLCMQKYVTADYKLMSVEGAYHAPTFMYRVQVGDVVATSTGASKKKAKHAAAMTILEKLLSEEGGFADGFESDGVKVTADNIHEIISDPISAASVEEEGQKNHVGELQELCIKNRWQPPFYETKAESGLPHEKIFTMACSVGTISEIGTGKSKRLAKREAAKKMLDKLHEINKSDSQKSKKSETDEVNNVAENSGTDVQPDSSSENTNSVMDDLVKSTQSNCNVDKQDKEESEHTNAVTLGNTYIIDNDNKTKNDYTLPENECNDEDEVLHESIKKGIDALTSFD